MTKVILNEPVYGLGEEGDICTVKDGYARNHLLPKNLAGSYTKHNLEIRKQKQKNILRRKEQRKKEAETLKAQIEQVFLNFKLKMAEEGRVFGSISSSDIAEALKEKDIHIERRSIEVSHSHIKTIGDHKVHIRLYEGVIVTLNIKVEPEIIKR